MSRNDLNKPFHRVFVTGDIHGNCQDLADRIAEIGDTTKDDLLFILGDCAFMFNCYYHPDHERDAHRRRVAARLPITIVCVQGNHEVPFAEMDAERIQLLGGDGYFRDGIYFAANGTQLTVNGKSFFVLGGAYSLDKEYRILYGRPYWPHEELSEAELNEIVTSVAGNAYDFILSHTCPLSDMPVEALLEGVDQSRIENRTEKALEKLKQAVAYNAWYCGHFHIDKTKDNLHFLYHDIEQIL